MSKPNNNHLWVRQSEAFMIENKGKKKFKISRNKELKLIEDFVVQNKVITVRPKKEYRPKYTAKSKLTLGNISRFDQ